jgi:hypothetical protein
VLKVIALVGVAGVMLAVSAGVVFAVLRAGQPTQSVGSGAATPGAIGSTGHLRPGGGSILWVDDAGLSAWNRAYANRDDKGEQAAFDLYETLTAPEGTRVKVTARKGDMIQIEVTSEPLIGRRGWVMGPLLP